MNLIFKPHDLKLPSPRLITQVHELLTPVDVLAREKFEAPAVINPTTCPDSNSLIMQRSRVRDLKLLPVKSKEMHKFYNSQRDDPRLVHEVEGYFGPHDESVLAENRFPYALPPSFRQYLIWTKLDVAACEELARFAAACVETLGRTAEDVLFFERSTTTNDKLVKGTFKAMRHVHFWIKTA